jgi:hypothetical protein
MKISRRILFGMRNVSEKTENQNTHFEFKKTPPPPPPENRAVYKIMWKYLVQTDRPQLTM